MSYTRETSDASNGWRAAAMGIVHVRCGPIGTAPVPRQEPCRAIRREAPTCAFGPSASPQMRNRRGLTCGHRARETPSVTAELRALPGPFTGPKAWTGDAMRATETWLDQLPDGMLDDLVRTTRRAASNGHTLATLTRSDFSVSDASRSRIAAWSDELAEGRGFVLVRGVPVSDLAANEVELLYFGLGLHLGVPVSQNTDGDLLGHVRDSGADPGDPGVRLYKTRAAQPFHTDGSDVVGLLCLQPAKSGGESTIVSSWAVYNAMRERRPDLAALLFEPFSFDLYEQQRPGEKGWFDTRIGNVVGDRLFTFYLRFYITQAQRHPEVAQLTEQQVEFLDTLDALCHELRLDMDFAPGDIQWLSNACIFHGRAAYEDHDEPVRRRHLLRLWLTLHRNSPDGAGYLGVDPT